MSPFPFFQVRLLLLCLILPVGEDVEEFNRTPTHHIIPGASAGLGGCVHIGYPTPLVRKASSCSSILAIIFSLFSLSLIPFAIRLE